MNGNMYRIFFSSMFFYGKFLEKWWENIPTVADPYCIFCGNLEDGTSWPLETAKPREFILKESN